MNQLESKFLGGMVALSVRDEATFNNLKSWLGTKNLFLENKEPASAMKFPGANTFVIYRDSTKLCITWSLLADIDQSIIKVVDANRFLEDVVIEVEAEVINELANPGDLVDFKVNKIIPATVDSNISTFKDEIIPKIKQYANTIVTEENYKEIKELVARLNNISKSINQGKVEVKKEAKKHVDIFEDEVKEILATFDATITELKKQIEVFTAKEQEDIRNERMTKIEALKQLLIGKDMISKEYADKFEFQDKWLLKKYSAGKSFEEEVSAEFEKLIGQEKADLKDIEFIRATIHTQCEAAKITNNLSKDKYIKIFKAGVGVGEIVKTITDDIKAIADNVKIAVEETKKEQEQNIEVTENVSESKEKGMQTCVDEKTGEVYAKYTDRMIVVQIQEDKDPEKLYKYSYQFEGNYRTIRTFAMFLKALAVVNSTFKYVGKMIKEDQ